MTITHLLTGALGVGILLQTPSPTLLLTGAIASLLPDLDISTSPAGRILPWISTYLEKRFSHRSCTHSLVASGILAIVTYGATLYLPIPLALIHALNIGYFFGWFLDCFTKSGVEMFYPLGIRCVCPGNRNLRLATASPAEYWLMAGLVAIALWVFQMNTHGGLIAQFNHMIAAPSGVEELFNAQGGSNLLVAHIEGVRASDRSPVKGDFPIIQTQGQGFLVLGEQGDIYKAGTEPDANIITNRITADVKQPAIVKVTSKTFNDEDLSKLQPYTQINAMVFVTGQLLVDDPEEIQIQTDPHQFPTVTLSTQSLIFESAPLQTVLNLLSNQFITGSLSLRSIYVNQ